MACFHEESEGSYITGFFPVTIGQTDWEAEGVKFVLSLSYPWFHLSLIRLARP